MKFLRDIYFKYWKKYGWFGDYDTWQSAEATCDGYDTADIFQKVYYASLKVRNGEAAYERDGHLFYTPENNIFLLKCLNNVLDTEGYVSVLDFGGALGSTYYQHRKFFEKKEYKWAIVEQKQFVGIGKKDFETHNLHFFETIDKAFEAVKPNVILFSSVLQYLENPDIWIKKASDMRIAYIILDLTTVHNKPIDRITKQIVPPQLYLASYPCRIFSEKRLTDLLRLNYNLEVEETAHYRNNILNCRFKKYFGKLKI